MFEDAIVYKNKLIMVMGLQRSGTSALTEAIGQDSALQVETESQDNDIYDNYFLRPEPEIRGILWSIKRRVLLKPISEIQRRSVEDVLQEYEDYGVRLVWIYRDPVNVWSSMGASLNVPDRLFHDWAALWNEGNRSVLKAKSGPYGEQIAIVRYEDLISQRQAFTELCRFLRVEDRNNLFWQADEKKGRRRLDPQLQRETEKLTQETLNELNFHRLRPPEAEQAEDREIITARYDLCKTAWALLNHGAGRAAIEPSVTSPTYMQILMEGAESSSQETVQVVQGPIAVRAGVTYTLSLWARSDKPRFIGCCLGQAKEPWEPLSEYHGMNLRPEWTAFHRDFHVRDDDPAARFYFDVGGDTSNVEISEPLLTAGIRYLCQIDIHGKGSGRLVHNPETPDFLRIEIDSKGGDATDVQLLQALGELSAKERYIVSFDARADAPRSASVAVGLDGEPWTGMGLFEEIELSPHWQRFEFEFDAVASGGCRLYFDLGQSQSSVELRKVRLGRTFVRLHQLKAVNGSEARLTFQASSVDAVRIEITKTGTGGESDIQISLCPRSVVAFRRYFVSFSARADRGRRFGFGAQLDREPWTTLGLYRHLELTPDWRKFYFEFTALETTEFGRVLFDLGAATTSVELADVEFGDAATDFVDADLPKLQRLVKILEHSRRPTFG